MADTASAKPSQEDDNSESTVGSATPAVQVTPVGSQELETQPSSPTPPKMSLEVPVVSITPPSPTPGDSQDKVAAPSSSTEKPEGEDGDTVQTSCEGTVLNIKPHVVKETLSLLQEIPDEHRHESAVLSNNEDVKKDPLQPTNVQIKSPLDNCSETQLVNTETISTTSDSNDEKSDERVVSESKSDENTSKQISNVSNTLSNTQDKVVEHTAEENIDSQKLAMNTTSIENSSSGCAEESLKKDANVFPSSNSVEKVCSSSPNSEGTTEKLASSLSQESVQAPSSHDNGASEVPLKTDDRSVSLPTESSDQQSSKTSPTSIPAKTSLSDTDSSSSVSSKENAEEMTSSTTECIGNASEEIVCNNLGNSTDGTEPISLPEKLNPKESDDVSITNKLTVKQVDEINDSHDLEKVNDEEDRSVEVVPQEVPVETIPVIVDSMTEQTNTSKIGQIQTSTTSGAVDVDTEHLQPVTIGSSLQPLEEIQEAAMPDDPSFAAADLALIDSSADEADSIGGLVINSVIGAADGVADFHPEDMETERELTDISSSAPQALGETCDNVDSSDELEPSAKRIRYENGANDIDDKLQTSRNVCMKVSPVKNGHGLWDASKLRQLLIEKGTILLQLHASVDHMEMNESDKENKDVDFSGIMIEAKDEDHDQILGLATLEPDADVYDPLAIGVAHNLDHVSPPHYSRSYPHHPRGRSTALQPAMTRPVFRHLQSPPHPPHYMKQDLLGHPQPLEFEEPQQGTTDWSGMVTHIAESPEPQEPSSPLMEEPASLMAPRMEQVRRRVRNVGRVIRMKKVCEHCGMAFNKSHQYMQHLRTHRPMQQCDKCSFKTKDMKRFRNHQISHKKENPQVKCNICSELFATDTTRRIHKKKIHRIFECKYCYKEFNFEENMLDHMGKNHGHIRDKPGYLTAREMRNVKPVNIFLDPPSPHVKGQFTCRLCNKETRNKYQLKIHIAQHLGVSSSKISDDFLITQDVEQFQREVGALQSLDCQKIENSDFLFPQPIKIEPGISVENCVSDRPINGLADKSGTSSNSSVTFSPDTSPTATMQDPFPLSPNPISQEIDIDIEEANPLLARTTLKEEPLDIYDRHDSLDVDLTVMSDDNTSVKCGLCGGGFLDVSELQTHVLRVHNKSVFRCGLCELNFPRPEDLYNHAITVHRNNTVNPEPSNPDTKLPLTRLSRILPGRQTKQLIQCDVCMESFKSHKTLKRHKKLNHRKVFSCQACGVTHYQSSKMIRHQKMFHKDKLRCRYLCMSLFDTEAERSDHHKKVHKKDDTKVICPYCQVEYQYEGNLMNHLDRCKSCPPDKRPAHVCGNCDLMLPSIEQYNIHIKNCRPCKKEIDKQKAQQKDPNKDNSTKGDTDPLQDAEASRGAAFKQGVNEESSTKDHEGAAPRRMINGRPLEPTNTSDREDVPLGKNLLQNQSLNSSPKAKYSKVCEYCGRKFNKKQAYIQHYNSHRPLQYCTVCSFKTKNDKKFKFHVAAHDKDDIELRCTICSVAFANVVYRRAHKKNIHNLFECNHCAVDLLSESHLQDHIKKNHGSKRGLGFAGENVEDGESSLTSSGTFDNINNKKWLVCRLCNKECRNKYQLKIHLAQHLGVSSSKITDEDLLSDTRQFSRRERNDSIKIIESSERTSNSVADMSGGSCIDSKNSGSSFNFSTSEDGIEMEDNETISSQSYGNFDVKEEPLEVDLTDQQGESELESDNVLAKDSGPIWQKIKCDQCDRAFTTLKSLRKHKKAKHKPKVQCPECNVVRSSTMKLIAHQKAAHKTKLRCHYLCLALFDNREELSAHHLQVHKKDDSKLVCRYCREKYPKGNYLAHIENCQRTPLMKTPFACNNCEISFASLSDLTSHLSFCSKITEPENKDLSIKETINKENQGSESLESTSTERTPNTEESSSFEEEKDQDSIIYGTAGVLTKHEEQVDNNEEAQKCKYCARTFNTVDEGINHVLCAHKSLLSKEPRMCHVCAKTFFSGLALCKHILKHYSDFGRWDSLLPPNLDMETVRSICWICKTKGMANHKRHANSRDDFIEKLLTTQYTEPEGSATYSCSACNESFQSRYAFWKHTKLHMSKKFFKNTEGGKRFKCSRCPMRFLKKSQLYGHLATHLLEPLSPQDDEDFDESEQESSSVLIDGTKNNLAQNKLIVKHAILAGKLSTSQDSQKCKHCRKKFRFLEDALKHVFTRHKAVLGRMHDDTQTCHVCDKTFMKPMLLCKHLLMHYQDLNMLDDVVPIDLLTKTRDRKYCWICNNTLGRKATKHINMRNSLIEHILSNDDEQNTTFPCSHCDEVCTSRYIFWKHISLHMYKFHKKSNADGKGDSSIPSNPEVAGLLQCSECLQQFDEKAALIKHLATHGLLPHTNDMTIKKIAKSKNKSITADKDKTVKYQIKSDDGNQLNTIRLRNKVADDPSFSNCSQKCTCCAEVFSDKNEAVRHVISLHNSAISETIFQPRKCHICGNVFQSQWCLCKHIAKHYSMLGMWDSLVPSDLLDNYDLSQCWICKGHLGKKYTDHTNKRNMLIEQFMSPRTNMVDVGDFKCSVCSKEMQGRLTFWRHVHIHLSRGPIKAKARNQTLPPQPENISDHDRCIFSCKECSLFFVSEQNLYEHLASHFLIQYDNEIDIEDSGSAEDSELNFSILPLETEMDLPEIKELEDDSIILDEMDESGTNNEAMEFESRNPLCEEENYDSEIEEENCDEVDTDYDMDTDEVVETDDEVAEDTDE